jgi:hypothetical protein
MAQAPKTPPEAPPRRVANPQPGSSVYGGRWGGGGDNSPGETGQPDRPEPIRPPSKQK